MLSRQRGTAHEHYIGVYGVVKQIHTTKCQLSLPGVLVKVKSLRKLGPGLTSAVIILCFQISNLQKKISKFLQKIVIKNGGSKSCTKYREPEIYRHEI